MMVWGMVYGLVLVIAGWVVAIWLDRRVDFRSLVTMWLIASGVTLGLFAVSVTIASVFRSEVCIASQVADSTTTSTTPVICE